MIDPFRIIAEFYPDADPAREILLRHSIAVRDKALRLRAASPLKDQLDPELLAAGALLHDLGIRECAAPKLHCRGRLPYLAHGLAGARLLREYAAARQLDLEPLARICERHTGTGLTATDIRTQQLPLPEQDFLPETPEEKLVCYADKFFSKSGDFREKPLAQVEREIARFGPANLARFAALRKLFP